MGRAREAGWAWNTQLFHKPEEIFSFICYLPVLPWFPPSPFVFEKDMKNPWLTIDLQMPSTVIILDIMLQFNGINNLNIK